MTQDHGWSTPQADDGSGGEARSGTDGGGSNPHPSGGPAPFVPPVPPGSEAQGWGQPPKATTPQTGDWGSDGSWQSASVHRPGIIPLRPLFLGEIMDGAFQALRTNPRSMIGISAVLLSFLSSITLLPLASALTQQAEMDDAEIAADLATLVSGSLVPGLLKMVAILVLNGLLVLAVSDAVLGRKTPLGDLWSRVKGRLPAIFGIAGLVFLGALGLFLTCLLPGFLVVMSGAKAFGVLLIVLGLLGGIFVMSLASARWSMAAPVLLLERRRALDSLRRSWNLVKGSTWRVFGILALAQIIVGIGGALLGAPFALGSEAVRTMSEDLDLTTALLSVLVSSIGEIVAGSIFFPFSAAVTALLYTDLRMRKEGLDVELIRAAQGGTRP
jgi:hypothetical protein